MEAEGSWDKHEQMVEESPVKESGEQAEKGRRRMATHLSSPGRLLVYGGELDMIIN